MHKNKFKNHPWVVVAATFGLILFSPMSAWAYSEASSEASSESGLSNLAWGGTGYGPGYPGFPGYGSGGYGGYGEIGYGYPGFGFGGYGGLYESGYGPSFPGFPGFGSNGEGYADYGISYAGYGPGFPGFPGYGSGGYGTGLSYGFNDDYQLPFPYQVPAYGPTNEPAPTIIAPTIIVPPATAPPKTSKPSYGLASVGRHTYAAVIRRGPRAAPMRAHRMHSRGASRSAQSVMHR